jgi:hypothetical protein
MPGGTVKLIAANIRWIMLISGMLTCSMAYAVLAPQTALHSTFGETLEGPLAEIVVRNWGVLVTLVGLMLIYGAFNAQSRTLALLVAGTSKLGFIGLVLSHGGQYLGQQAGLAIAIDAMWVVLFACYLIQSRIARADQG